MRDSLLISQLLIPALTILVTVALAIYGVRSAVTTFKAQRTWERRVDAYADLLEQIAQVQLASGAWADRLEQSAVMEHRAEREALKQAHTAYNRAKAIADLLLPGVANEPLLNLSNRLDQTLMLESYETFDFLNDVYGCAEIARAELTKEGHKQLTS